MANKMRKFLAWVMVLTLLAGQLALPAAAEEIPETPAVNSETPAETPAPASVEVIVDVSPVVPEAPAAEPQAPAPSDTVEVVISEPVTTSAPAAVEGVTEQSTSSTTTWTGSEGGTVSSGSETTTTVSGTDDTTGQTLYQGGTTSGSETSVTTSEPVTDSSTEEGYVTKEVNTSVENTSTESGSASTTESSTVTESGDWVNTEKGFTEGQFEADKTVEKNETTTTETLGQEAISKDGINIGLTVDEDASDAKKGTYTFTGSAGGEIISLGENVSIPENATPVTDAEGNVIGYTLETSTETITGTEVKEGTAQQDAANSSTDTTGSTAAVTPDLDTATEKLGVHIDDKSQITEETDADGKVTAYVITNTSKKEEAISSIGQLQRPEAGSFPQADGSTLTRTVEETKDADGNAVVKIIEVKTDANGKELGRSETTQTIIENEIPAAAEPQVVYTLPEKPAASVSTEDGITTTVTVTELLDADGKIIGYKSTTVKTDEAGAELYREENDLYGTEETITQSVTTDNPGSAGSATVKTTVVETSRVTAEETTFEDIATYNRLNKIVNDMTVDKTHEVVMIDGKLYYIYTGTVTVSEGDEHGDIKLMNPVTPMSSLFNKSDSKDLSLGNEAAYYTDWRGNFTGWVDPGKPEKGFKYIGEGVDSSLSINKGYGQQQESSGVTQFRLISSDDKVYYAMCIDFNTGIQTGHLYNIEDIRDATYLQQSGEETISAAEKIRSVALNGYWGTESGVGSLEDVQTFLTAYLEGLDANNDNKADLSAQDVQNIVNALTPGQAQAATQAALWMFGNKDGSKPVNTTDLVSGDDKTDETMVKHLFNALLDSANDPSSKLNEDEGVEFLDAEDITATSIVVKEKVASADDASNTSGKNVYNTDLNFTLGIEPTKLFGDLKVTVYDNNGKEVKTVVLASKDKTIFGLKPDDNGMYTIPDIEIAEGVSVNLKLYGTQDLGTGVYIYTSLEGTFNNSQTLVTLATGSRKVDLDISMKLDVQEPTVTKTTSGETQYGTRTDTQKQSKTDKIQRKSTTTKSEWETVRTEETESSQVFTSDVTLNSVSTKQTKSEKSWTFSWLKKFEPEAKPEDDDFPIVPTEKDPDPQPQKDDSPIVPADPQTGDEDSRHVSDYTPEGRPAARKANLKKTMTITDEKVPLAKAPKTGDLSGIWAVISGISLGGMALLNAKRKEEE